MKFLLHIFLISILFQKALYAQKTSEDYLGSWYALGLNHRFTDQFSMSPYGELRFYEPTANFNLVFVSLSTNYHLNQNHTFSLAYAYLDIDTVLGYDKRPNTKENRIFEQYTYTHKLKMFSVQHRFRLEQRFLNAVDKNDIQHRFRYRLSFKYAINKSIFVSLKEEPFINFQDQSFHENRFFIGLGINLFQNTQFEIDYLKHHIKKNNLNRIQIGISIKTDSRRSKPTLKHP
ncbi:DUF2490 domain-containing protein [Winogradskyella bathintestinalis]|uniref:DUF2490 domain-containing protein n=1 Tax=Winogradskyella bathintestinalis TaxID=3035208 RepID=A0ABT7ZWE4_9FLAO|nr:DUF2490 domain-containing protein [Winogradskyella bathintestinalis]MDN3493338.1 DUF2490 domain-containing protein [Winogradskyella bathintestinalis]